MTDKKPSQVILDALGELGYLSEAHENCMALIKEQSDRIQQLEDENRHLKRMLRYEDK